jgi:hypothetical protein
MGKDFMNNISQKTAAERVALFFACVIAAVLTIAAWGKFFYPAELLIIFERWVGGAEVLFLLAILIFRKKWVFWLFTATIFASWCGYALYWYFLELPCSCMGTMLNIPTAFTMFLDALFFSWSLLSAYLLGAPPRWIAIGLISSVIASFIGYAIAHWVYMAFVHASS